jgi:hypothetical protein
MHDLSLEDRKKIIRHLKHNGGHGGAVFVADLV